MGIHHHHMDDTRKAYLIFSPGFGTSFLSSLVLLGLLSQLSARYARPYWDQLWQKLQIELMIAASSLAWWSVMGLLSSACCLLQILLNALSLGCAGFNTYLGPARPFFLAATTMLQYSGWLVVVNNPIADWRYTALGSGLAFTLALMPEMIYLYQQLRPKTTCIPASVAVLKLEGMGCVSCASTVRNVAHQHSTVLDVSVSVNDGTATIQSSLLQPEAVSQFELLAQQISQAKFPCTVLSVRPFTPPKDAPANKEAIDIPEQTQSSLRRWGVAVAAGLASSSCCVLQLLINALSYLDVLHVGCAGFNKILGPVRGPLRVATIAGLAMLWRHPKKRTLLLAAQTCLTMGIMLAPELLLISGAPALAPATGDTVQYDIVMDGMGCEACQMHVQKLLERSSGVVSAQVDFETGVAAVVVAEGWGFDMPQTQLKLEADGYLVTSIARANSTIEISSAESSTEYRTEI